MAVQRPSCWNARVLASDPPSPNKVEMAVQRPSCWNNMSSIHWMPGCIRVEMAVQRPSCWNLPADFANPGVITQSKWQSSALLAGTPVMSAPKRSVFSVSKWQSSALLAGTMCRPEKPRPWPTLKWQSSALLAGTNARLLRNLLADHVEMAVQRPSCWNLVRGEHRLEDELVGRNGSPAPFLLERASSGNDSNGVQHE